MAVSFRTSGAVVVQMDPSAPARLTRRGGIVDVYTRQKSDTIAGVARQLVPVKTGRLRASIKAQQSHQVSGRFTSGYEVQADTPYATYVHEGTRPHVIEGHPLLVFQVGSTTVFTTRVNHPGTRGQPFLLRATQAVIGGTR